MPEPQPEPYVFDLDAGRPCLDFANTQSFSGPDHLTTYADLLAFAAQSQLLTPATVAGLRGQAERSPAAAVSTLQRARSLRQSLRGVFTALADNALAQEADLEVLNANLAASLPHARVLRDDSGAYGWGWDGTDLDSPLWPIVRSAADVLTSEHERALVRECGASDCAWLFMDGTKNRSRQWCSMTSCGNREKARRHYQRVKAQRTPGKLNQAAKSAAAGPRPGQNSL